MKKIKYTPLLFFCFCLILACKNKDAKPDKPSVTTSNDTLVTSSVAPSMSTYSAADISTWFNQSKNAPILANKSSVLALYKTRHFAPIWQDETKRKSLFQALKNADLEGLNFTDYHGKRLQSLADHYAGNSPSEQASLDILLTDAYFTYAHDLFYGKLNPKKMYSEWGLTRKKINFTKRLNQAIEQKTIAESLAQLAPQNDIYNGLKASLADYKTILAKASSITEIPSGETIRFGDTSDRIPTLIKRLKELGLLSKNYTEPSQIYNDSLQKSVKKFQQNNGLTVDGIIGSTTLRALNLSPKDYYEKIRANLERWRWYPRDLGNYYILVNIADYKLSLIKDAKLLQTHRVIVGDKNHHTPVFSDAIKYIVINPQWHIPSSIRNREIIPKAASNPTYLKKERIYIRTSSGQIVNPDTIHWSGNAVRTYRFIQKPGPSNSLGRLKIIYPNQYAIYLHDTPAKYIFKHSMRAESHGCVRVQNILELAESLLNNQQSWSLKELKKAIDSNKTIHIKVTQPVKVYHLYWTAWRAEDKTVFINDIYNLDKEIISKL